jgi:hypothetical protein
VSARRGSPGSVTGRATGCDASRAVAGGIGITPDVIVGIESSGAAKSDGRGGAGGCAGGGGAGIGLAGGRVAGTGGGTDGLVFARGGGGSLAAAALGAVGGGGNGGAVAARPGTGGGCGRGGRGGSAPGAGGSPAPLPSEPDWEDTRRRYRRRCRWSK